MSQGRSRLVLGIVHSASIGVHPGCERVPSGGTCAAGGRIVRRPACKPRGAARRLAMLPVFRRNATFYAFVCFPSTEARALPGEGRA